MSLPRGGTGAKKGKRGMDGLVSLGIVGPRREARTTGY